VCSYLAHAVVSELNVTLSVKQNIVQLQVTIHNACPHTTNSSGSRRGVVCAFVPQRTLLKDVVVAVVVIVVGEVWYCFQCVSLWEPSDSAIHVVVVVVVAVAVVIVAVVVVGEVSCCFQSVGCVSVCPARNPADPLLASMTSCCCA